MWTSSNTMNKKKQFVQTSRLHIHNVPSYLESFLKSITLYFIWNVITVFYAMAMMDFAYTLTEHIDFYLHCRIDFDNAPDHENMFCALAHRELNPPRLLCQNVGVNHAHHWSCLWDFFLFQSPYLITFQTFPPSSYTITHLKTHKHRIIYFL